MSEEDRPALVRAFVMSGWSNSTYLVELVVSGRIAATLPLPAAASGFRAAIAVKSLVNDDVEMVGVEPELDVEVVDVAAAVDVVDAAAAGVEAELELDLELPQPAANTTNTTPITDSRNRLKLITARSSHRRATSRYVLTVFSRSSTPAGKYTG